MGKDGEKCEMIKIGHSELFWTTLVEKMGNVLNDENSKFQIILDHLGWKRWEKCEMMKIGHSKSFWTTLVEKDGEKAK